MARADSNPVHDGRIVANWFIDRTEKDGRVMTIMKLLKLVYIAHGWHLEFIGKPLIRNPIEAWRHGPVIPEVYDAYRSEDRNVIDVKRVTIDSPDTALDDEQIKLLEDVYSAYEDLDGTALSDITHVPRGPWDITLNRDGQAAPISNQLIKQYYHALRKNAESALDKWKR